MAPLTAVAETPMTGAEFEAYIGTSTLTYLYNSGLRGAADYATDRKLRWAFEGDVCVDGYWYQQDDRLCFVFDDARLSQCWHFYRDPAGIRGIGVEVTDDLQIVEIARSETPLACAGPDLGA